MADQAEADLIALTTEIVASYVGKNAIAANELPALIASVHGAVKDIATGKVGPAPAEPPKPFVPIRKSVTPDYIISLEDGRQFRSMKRYLAGKGMTPDDYRAKWGLPKDYPMVAPNYAAQRLELAKKLGLGQGGRKRAAKGRKRSGWVIPPVQCLREDICPASSRRLVRPRQQPIGVAESRSGLFQRAALYRPVPQSYSATLCILEYPQDRPSLRMKAA